MKKGSLVTMKEGIQFSPRHFMQAYFKRILLPLPGDILTLKEDPIVGMCGCGSPDCENGTRLLFEEIPNGTFSMTMFEEVQTPEEVTVINLLK